MVAEVAPAPFRGERFSRKVRREALQPEKLEERLPRPALAVDKEILEGDCMYERVALREAECPPPCGRPVTIITGGPAAPARSDVSSALTAAALRSTAHARRRRIRTINDVYALRRLASRHEDSKGQNCKLMGMAGVSRRQAIGNHYRQLQK